MESLLSVTQFSRLHLEATNSLHCDPHSLVLDEVYEVIKVVLCSTHVQYHCNHFVKVCDGIRVRPVSQ